MNNSYTNRSNSESYHQRNRTPPPNLKDNIDEKKTAIKKHTTQCNNGPSLTPKRRNFGQDLKLDINKINSKNQNSKNLMVSSERILQNKDNQLNQKCNEINNRTKMNWIDNNPYKKAQKAQEKKRLFDENESSYENIPYETGNFGIKMKKSGHKQGSYSYSTSRSVSVSKNMTRSEICLPNKNKSKISNEEKIQIKHIISTQVYYNFF